MTSAHPPTLFPCTEKANLIFVLVLERNARTTEATENFLFKIFYHHNQTVMLIKRIYTRLLIQKATKTTQDTFCRLQRNSKAYPVGPNPEINILLYYKKVIKRNHQINLSYMFEV